MTTMTNDDLEHRKEALAEVESVTLDLRNAITIDDENRPRLSVWPDYEERIGFCVNVAIGALFGQQQRFVELTPGEARELAAKLTRMADLAEAAGEEL